jgi:hypothetical protein
VETKRSLITFGHCLVAAVPAVAAVLGLRALLDINGVNGAVWGAWLDLVLTTVVVGVVMGAALIALRNPELSGVIRGTVLARWTRQPPK